MESIPSDFINSENFSFEEEFNYNKISNDRTVRSTLVEVSKQNSKQDQLFKSNFEFEFGNFIILDKNLHLSFDKVQKD